MRPQVGGSRDSALIRNQQDAGREAGPDHLPADQATHERLRVQAFESRKTKQPIVDELFASCMVERTMADGNQSSRGIGPRGTMSDLYVTDIVTWADVQAELLRRRAAGELVNEADIDWPNVVEEIASVGQSQVDAIESLLFQAFVHDLKAQGWPLRGDVDSWRADARGFRAQARRKFRESMRQTLNVAGIYADALEAVPDTMDGQAPMPLDRRCPVTLDELLAPPLAR